MFLIAVPITVVQIVSLNWKELVHKYVPLDRGSRFRFPARAGNFSLHHRFQNGSGAHPASYPMDNRVSFLGVKRPGREANHSPTSSAEVEECVELYLHSPIHLHGVVLSYSAWTTLPLTLPLLSNLRCVYSLLPLLK